MVAAAGYPLTVGGKVIGAIVVFFQRRLEGNTSDSLAVIADQLALTIERVRREEVIRRVGELAGDFDFKEAQEMLSSVAEDIGISLRQ